MRISLEQLRHSRRFGEMTGLLLLVLAVMTLVSVASYTAQDPNWANSIVREGATRNWLGRVGANLSEMLLQLFGAAAFAAPLVLAAIGWLRLRNRPLGRYGWQIGAGTLLALALAGLLHLLYEPIRYGGELFAPGGVTGRAVAAVLVAMLNRPGALIFCSLTVAATIVFLSRVSFARTAELAWAGSVAAWGQVRSWSTQARESWRAWAERRRAAATPRIETPARPPVPAEPPTEPAAPVARRTIPVPGALDPPAPAEAAAAPAPPAAAAPRGKRAPTRPAPRQSSLPLGPEARGYALPPLFLLNEPEPQPVDNEKELLRRAEQLTEKFREFSLQGSVVAIHPGPVVTTFEFKPEAGVKYSKLTNMTDDLCLALKAESVRIDRMPGRSTVGIEVPKRKQETIYPRELIGSERFRSSSSKLALALGKDIGGDVYTAELNRMPHLLIAGATGAGKSVMLNGIIVSILFKSTPADVRMIMIDTKMIELGIYADIPHLLVPVVTDPKQASTALKWAVREMEVRYRKLAAVGVRNIEQFNKLLDREPDRTMESGGEDEPVPLTHLPYIVIVIDEMADLMIVAAADVEESVMRLAQMARAVGIHLILATQRPSVDVITGTIKANFPARIAFRVSQRVDSRTIIDQNGAEQLLGRGDMLYLPAGSSRLLRLHSGFITEPEIHRLTEFLRKTSDPEYDDSVLAEPEESAPGFAGGERDTMYIEAVRLVLQEGMCSITLIQRRLRLGYARAARIVDMMQLEGIVGPADGSKPRDLLVGPEILESLEGSASPR